MDKLEEVQAQDLKVMEGPVGIFAAMWDLWHGMEAAAAAKGYDIFLAGKRARLNMAALRQLLTWLAVEQHAEKFHHSLPNLLDQTKRDLETLRKKDRDYGGSWKQRGGVGAMMMACRKWDRIQQQVNNFCGDLYRAMRQDQRDEGIADDVNDLRCYLLLIEAEWQCKDELLEGDETPFEE